MKKVMAEKMKLLQLEQDATAHLTYEAKVQSEKLAEIESMAEDKTRKRELTLTLLY
jgi:hypothetical protein